MLKRYFKNVLISLGCGALVFFLSSFKSEEIFDVNFFRMLSVMLFIIGSAGFFIYEFSKNAILNAVLQTFVMVITAVIVPMVFGIVEYNLWGILSTIGAIAILYPTILFIVSKIQKRNLKKINEKLSKNKE